MPNWSTPRKIWDAEVWSIVFICIQQSWDWVLQEQSFFKGNPVGLKNRQILLIGWHLPSSNQTRQGTFPAMFDDNVGNLGWPRHFQKQVGRKALAMVNDPLHKKIRTLNSRAFADKQLDSYLPKLQKLSAKYLEDWVGKPSSDLHFEAGELVHVGKLCRFLSTKDWQSHVFDDIMGFPKQDVLVMAASGISRGSLC